MYCHKCGTELPDGTLYCSSCCTTQGVQAQHEGDDLMDAEKYFQMLRENRIQMEDRLRKEITDVELRNATVYDRLMRLLRN